MYDLSSHDWHYILRLGNADSDTATEQQTRLYEKGTEGQFPH